MLEFDEDRPSISGRRISSNIPPTIEGYEESRWWLRRALPAAIAVSLLVGLLIAAFR
jgi:hypothetical protein